MSQAAEWDGMGKKVCDGGKEERRRVTRRGKLCGESKFGRVNMFRVSPLRLPRILEGPGP